MESASTTQSTQCFYDKINIFFGDMRLEKYTYDVRECRANGVPAKLVLWGKQRGARRERTNITKTGKMQSIFPEREALNPTKMRSISRRER